MHNTESVHRPLMGQLGRCPPVQFPIVLNITASRTISTQDIDGPSSGPASFCIRIIRLLCLCLLEWQINVFIMILCCWHLFPSLMGLSATLLTHVYTVTERHSENQLFSGRFHSDLLVIRCRSCD